MKVHLLAHTTVGDLPDSVKGTELHEYLNGTHVNDGDFLAHFAGRACYQSWKMPNPATATDQGYISNIINQGHFSVLEHASATFYLEGVSRALTHELVRHRHLSYSQLSQRYVDESDADFVVPPALRGELSETELAVLFSNAVEDYEVFTNKLIGRGLSRKKAREAARAVLPNMTETKIVVTGNHRAWRDMLHKRYSVHADAEILELATEILRQLKGIAPASYQDFGDQPFE